MAALHTDRSYNEELARVRESLLSMAGRVEAMITDAMTALDTRDVELAQRAINADHSVNRAEVETDELCLVILAKRQPMASDLRFITLSLKMVTDLERIGDLAVNICERAIDLTAFPDAKLPEELRQMAAHVQGMVTDAIDSFVDRDASKAERVMARDDVVDKLYTKVFRELLSDMMASSAHVEQDVHIQSVAKWLERMGDHAVNLAELVIFLIRGRDIRHLGSMPVDA
ncbi:MAG: phosphate signaling complex protein PhoU [Myxococcales bacterium FL481]|nr:MAG: phosphate signaling complex protein PhoU [Myxococcales bacterium FL481]